MAIRLVQLRRDDLDQAAMFILEAQEWSPQTNLAINPGEVLLAPNAVWMSALSQDDLVGIVGVHSVNWVDGSGELALGVVPKWRTQGVGKILAHLLNEYATKDLGLTRLTMSAIAGAPSCKIAKAVGLTLESVSKAVRRKAGRKHDVENWVLRVGD